VKLRTTVQCPVFLVYSAIFILFIFNGQSAINDAAAAIIIAIVLMMSVSSQLLVVSGAKMFVQMTFGVLVLCVLSTSYQIKQYRAVKSDSGEVLCAVSPPNKTLNAVAERTKCTIECSRGCQSPCHAINYRQTSQLCELFYYEPCSYDLQPDCYNYKVVND